MDELLEQLTEVFEVICEEKGIDTNFLVFDEDTLEVMPDPSTTLEEGELIKLGNSILYIKKDDIKLIEEEFQKTVKS